MCSQGAAEAVQLMVVRAAGNDTARSLLQHLRSLLEGPTKPRAPGERVGLLTGVSALAAGPGCKQALAGLAPEAVEFICSNYRWVYCLSRCPHRLYRVRTHIYGF